MTTETAIRKTKQQLIVEYMTINLGKKFGTMELHIKFGTSFRARVSDINRDHKCPIIIRNETHVQGQSETSVYWSERRTDADRLWYQREEEQPLINSEDDRVGGE